MPNGDLNILFYIIRVLKPTVKAVWCVDCVHHVWVWGGGGVLKPRASFYPEGWRVLVNSNQLSENVSTGPPYTSPFLIQLQAS
jgi:hypothetical protein